MKKDCSYYQSKCSKCHPTVLTQAQQTRHMVDCLVNDMLLQTRPCTN